MEVWLGAQPFPYSTASSNLGLSPTLFEQLMGDILLPFATTLLLPVVAFTIVHEKELKLRSSMNVMGLVSSVYYAERFAMDFALVFSVHIVLYVAGIIMQLDIFTKSQGGLLLLLFAIWSFTLVALSFAFSAVFSRTRTSSIVL